MISKSAKTEIVKPESSAVFLHLLKVEAQGYETLYFVDNTAAVISLVVVLPTLPVTPTTVG